MIPLLSSRIVTQLARTISSTSSTSTQLPIGRRADWSLLKPRCGSTRIQPRPISPWRTSILGAGAITTRPTTNWRPPNLVCPTAPPFSLSLVRGSPPGSLGGRRATFAVRSNSIRAASMRSIAADTYVLLRQFDCHGWLRPRDRCWPFDRQPRPIHRRGHYSAPGWRSAADLMWVGGKRRCASCWRSSTAITNARRAS